MTASPDRSADEINYEVANKVMGWVAALVNSFGTTVPVWHDDNGDYICRADEWRPSENITDAWAVVREMRGHGFVTLTDCGDHWDATHQAGSVAAHIGHRDESACVAICHMALKATAALRAAGRVGSK